MTSKKEKEEKKEEKGGGKGGKGGQTGGKGGRKEEPKGKVKEVEYRTVEWAKDALYFSYEPNFLFLGILDVLCTGNYINVQLNDTADL